MNSVITFTPAQLVAIILSICGSIITISAAVSIIAKLFEKAKLPEEKQNARLDSLEKHLGEIDEVIETFKEYFANDDKRFKAIEKSNKVTQTALLALLKHSINGNDQASLKEAEKSLEEYLIEK